MIIKVRGDTKKFSANDKSSSVDALDPEGKDEAVLGPSQETQVGDGSESKEGLLVDQAITGRAIFVVHIAESAVVVESGFLVEDGRLMRMPAVFPNRQYALEQIEELRKIINRNFDEIEGSPAA